MASQAPKTWLGLSTGLVLVVAVVITGVAVVVGCQDYVFETRPPKRSVAKKIGESIATIVPADILFVIDNSGSMQEEIQELRTNVGFFINELVKSENEFQVGVITTDVECRVPSNDCSLATPTTSWACCGPPIKGVCDDDPNSDSSFVDSNCDGGRLRASPVGQKRRIFGRPAEGEVQDWITEFDAILGQILSEVNSGDGSSFEAGLEAVRRAVGCAAGESCTAPILQPIAQINAGFIRPEADLVIIFLTDEDDCSACLTGGASGACLLPEEVIYQRPAAVPDQEFGFCSPDECYGSYGTSLDFDSDGLMDWADPDNLGLLKCGSGGTIDRVVNPPELTGVSAFLESLIAAKGGDVSKVRAAGIVSALETPAQETCLAHIDAPTCQSGACDWDAGLGVCVAKPLGHLPAACVGTSLGPSSNCGCLATAVAEDLWCELTSVIGQRNDHFPPPGTGGCDAMPGGRYMQFLELLADRRVAAHARRDTLVDSICRGEYDDTIYKIVNTIILTSCFGLGDIPPDLDASRITVRLNGEELPHIGLACDKHSLGCDTQLNQTDCEDAQCLWEVVGGCLPDPQTCGDADCIWDQDASGGDGACVDPTEQGWSWVEGAREVCLENGLRKEIGDEFEIFILTTTPTTP